MFEGSTPVQTVDNKLKSVRYFLDQLCQFTDFTQCGLRMLEGDISIINADMRKRLDLIGQQLRNEEITLQLVLEMQRSLCSAMAEATFMTFIIGSIRVENDNLKSALSAMLETTEKSIKALLQDLCHLQSLLQEGKE